MSFSFGVSADTSADEKNSAPSKTQAVSRRIIEFLMDRKIAWFPMGDNLPPVRYAARMEISWSAAHSIRLSEVTGVEQWPPSDWCHWAFAPPEISCPDRVCGGPISIQHLNVNEYAGSLGYGIMPRATLGIIIREVGGN
jgi:hypothetical protein